jgi:serine/threonine protein phosphatase PrpC
MTDSTFAASFSKKKKRKTVSITDLINSGGPEVADHAKTHLIPTIDRRLAMCDDYEQAIKDAMVEEDTAIRKTGMLQPGSTAALALINVKEGFVVVGDLGDSHVVLAERVPEKKGIWKAKCLSFAQKPWSKEERERIHDAGGKLNRVYGETRLGEDCEHVTLSMF